MLRPKSVGSRLAVFGVFLLLGLIAIQFGVLPLFDPLRQSSQRISESLLSEFPIGSSRDEVLDGIKRHGWPLGVRIGSIPVPESTVGATVGSYNDWLVVRMTVVAFWFFDKNDRLERVQVERFATNML